MSYKPSVRTHYSQEQFAYSQTPKVQRSKFDRSHNHKTTFDGGRLIPIYVDEALPGDTFHLRLNAFGRLATLLDPLMDNLWIDYFFFAVPHRLLWDNWSYFMGEDPPAGSPTEWTPPTVFINNQVQEGTLFDYLGIPLGVDTFNVSAFPSRAYHFVYNEWFRDENFEGHSGGLNYIKHPTDDGPDAMITQQVRRRGKRKDYFTGALPWPQKGDDVTIGLGGTVPITGTGTPTFDGGGTFNQEVFVDGAGTDHLFLQGNPTSDTAVVWNDPHLVGDLSSATAVTVNELREAIAVQQFLEIDARSGTRLTETIQAHFGVVSEDMRLQRPEYLGGGRSYMHINPVVQTTQELGDDNHSLGTLAAYGTTSTQNVGFTKSFTEHCILLGIACATAELTYHEGLERMWTREGKYDFYWPALSHLGEQAIFNRELVLEGNAGGNNDFEVWGYNERYSEYRYKQSRLSGLFRPGAAQPLSSWHLAQELGPTAPPLDQQFIWEDPPIDRVIVTTDQPQIVMDMHFDLKCARPMPVYGTPGLRRL